jgi:hypothetical protein
MHINLLIFFKQGEIPHFIRNDRVMMGQDDRSGDSISTYSGLLSVLLHQG